jgi:hypothetical protein
MPCILIQAFTKTEIDMLSENCYASIVCIELRYVIEGVT